jgi:hypothetical protein
MRFPRLYMLPALAIIGPLSVTPVSAGFFDSLFGTSAPPQAPAPAVAPSPGMTVTISPKSFARPRAEAVRARRVVSKHKAVRQAAAPANLDPSQDAEWFLKDPTLRAGDIVVLEREVLVLNGRGRGPLTRANFTSLDKASAPSDARAMLGPNMPAQSASNTTEPKAVPEFKAASLDTASSSARR